MKGYFRVLVSRNISSTFDQEFVHEMNRFVFLLGYG